MCEDVRSRERIKNCSGLEQTKKKRGGADSGDNPEPEREKKDTSGAAGEVWSSWTGWGQYHQCCGLCGWEVCKVAR